MPYSPRKTALGASISLLLFSGLTTVALAAWFLRATEPWTWRSVVAVAAAAVALIESALIWRAPSRSAIVGGIVTMAASLVRIGPPAEWTLVSLMLVTVTFALMIPLVHAAIILR